MITTISDGGMSNVPFIKFRGRFVKLRTDTNKQKFKRKSLVMVKNN